MNAAVFLDRDNTIIHNDGDLGDPELVKLIQGAASAIASLRGLNYKIIVVTNQGGVARGKYGETEVENTNQRVADLVKNSSGASIDRFYYCPYHPNGTVPQYTCEHEWRKPQPGMLLQAAKDMNIDLSQSWMIGDQMRDVQAGAAAGVRCILLREDAGDLQPLRSDQLKSGNIEVTGDIHHFTARNLIEAVRIIAKQRKPEAELISEPTPRKWDAAAVRAARESNNPSASPVASPAVNPPTPAPVPTQPKPTGSEPVKPATSPREGHAPAPLGQVSTPRTTATKPFKPWGVSDTAPVKAYPGHASTQPTQPVEKVEAPAAAPAAAPAPTKTSPTVDPDSNLEPHELAHMQQAESLAKSETSNTAADQELDDAESFDETAPGTSRRSPASDVTLRQILQELRGQRSVQNDFSYVRMLAVVFQILAGFLLLAGLFLGATEADIFLRWIGTAVLVQLAAIALILLER